MKFRRALLLRATPLLLLASTLSPSGAWASELPAGFATTPVWISRSAPTEGMVVKLVTVVFNSSSDPISGTAVFSVDGQSAGSVHFQEPAGESQVLSVPWTATAGTHTLDAHVEGAIGAGTSPITLASASTSALTVVVSSAPSSVVIPSLPLGLGSSVQSLASNTLLASTTPVIARIVGSVASTTESIRTSAAAYLRTQLATTSAAIAAVDASSTRNGDVLGAQIERADPDASAGSTKGSTPSGWGRTILSLLLTIASSVFLFYPICALLLFIALYFIAKRLRNPGRRGSRGRN